MVGTLQKFLIHGSSLHSMTWHFDDNLEPATTSVAM